MATTRELLPCPFCGGSPTAIETHPGRGELYCGKCDVVLGGNEAKTPEELTEAWNTRAERTCQDLQGTDDNGQPVFHCSKCGCVASLYQADGTNNLVTNHIYDCYRYCPNCGAKAVD